jgi:hypothetical protein
MGSAIAQAESGIADAPGLLLPQLAQFAREITGPLKTALGPERTAKLVRIRLAFESDIPPAEGFLRWLLLHPGQMKWPMKTRINERKFGKPTQDKRKRLLAGDLRVQSEALRELEAYGAAGSRRKWWAFEGYTSVDCRLETDQLVVLIEGKRTEPVSSATDWFPWRNQIIRNLEVARALAGGKKSYAVIVCSEKDVSLEDESWAESLPHMTEAERTDLRSHFLGSVTWAAIAEKLCGKMKLPDKLDESVNLCLGFR